MPEDDSGSYPGRALLRALVPRRVPERDLVEKISLYDATRAASGRAIARWLADSQPSAQSAWVLGEALGLEATGVARVEGANGFLALYWFGRLKDLVGVLASCEPRFLVHRADLLRELLPLAPATAHVSAFDDLPPGHPIFASWVDAAQLRRIAAALARPNLRDLDFEAEAEALGARADAIDAWEKARPLVGKGFADAALRWFGSWENGVAPRDAADDVARMPAPLRDAYALADGPRRRRGLTESLVLDLLVRWLRLPMG